MLSFKCVACQMDILC
uniref:Uncharacterized protein n=1 Tax=Anguilla anguilla TaxID=7936 RepID=A0A0E9TZB5_ANGAN